MNEVALEEAIAALPWRANQLAPHEPRMPAHEYVLRQWCSEDPERATAWRAVLTAVRSHPDAYLAYFRAYQRPNRYLQVGEQRYWESWIGNKQFLNRARLDSCEPPRRVDEGATPISLRDWGAGEAYWPRDSGFGRWDRVGDEWVFTRTEDRFQRMTGETR